MTRARWALRLALLVPIALTIFVVVDTGLYRRAPHSILATCADLRLTSLAIIATMFLVSDARRLVRPPRLDLRTIPWLVGWLACTAVAVHFFGIGRVALARWQDVTAFMTTGLLGEELLIRGLVLAAAWRVWPPQSVRPGRAVIFSAATFSLLHLQYHGFRIDHAAPQLMWTFPLGVLLGWTVERTESVWPAVAVHLLNNAIALS